MKKIILCFIYLLVSIISSAQTQYDYYDDNTVAGGADRALNGIIIIVILVIVAIVLILVLSGAVNLYFWINPKADPKYKREMQKIQEEKQHQQYIFEMRQKAVPKAVDLGLSVKWSSFNLGAYKASDVGDRFYWAENTPSKVGYPKYSKANVNVIGDISGIKEYDAATNLLGDNWRMPTEKEFRELLEKCKWESKTIDGIEGRFITSNNGNSIFLPFNQNDFSTGKPKSGHYWSSSPSFDSNNSESSVDLRFGENCKFPAEIWRATSASCLFCIRPVFSTIKYDFQKEFNNIIKAFLDLKYYNISNRDAYFHFYNNESKTKEEEVITNSFLGISFKEGTFIKDEYEVLYSLDGKRLLDASHCTSKEYSIKEGTEIICQDSFKQIFFKNSMLNRHSLVKKIILPKSLIYLSKSIIRYDLEIFSNSPYYSIIDDLLIDQRKKSIIKCLKEFKQIVIIGEPIEEIEENAFRNMVALRYVYIPSTLKRIGSNAFRNCQNLSKINLNNSIDIGAEAFLFCNSLKTDFVP